MAHDDPDGTVPCRVVLYAAPSAAVFPIDAGPYTGPLATFAIGAHQELPRAAPGAPGLTTPAFSHVEVGGVTVRPAGPINVGDRALHVMFAERGQLLVRPGYQGSPSAWREPTPIGTMALVDYEESVHRVGRRSLLGGVAAVLGVAGFVVFWIATGEVAFKAAVSLALGAGLSLQAWWRARRAKGTVRLARRTSDDPARTMALTLRWCAGYGRGPIAVAALAPIGDQAEAVDVEVVGVPDGFDPPAGSAVAVRGDLSGDRGITIQIDRVTLWSSGRPP